MKPVTVCRLTVLTSLLATAFVLSCKKEITFIYQSKPEVVILPGDSRLLDVSIHFVKDTVYVLGANLVRNAGQTFIADAGTLIKVRDKVAIEINAGGKIEANGTVQEPVVFTSASLKGAPGRLVTGVASGESYWYGISLTGSAGISSGSLSFVRIEFAGGYRGIDGEAALSLYNVDKATTLQNIQVSYSHYNPSFNFFGGNANAMNLISYSALNSDFILENGYTGMMQNLLAYRHPFFSSACTNTCDGVDLAGVLIRGANTFPALSNLTVLGPGSQTGTNKKYSDTSFNVTAAGRVSALLVRGGRFHIRNSVLAGFPETAFHLDNRSSAVSLNSDESEFSYSIVQSDTNRVFYLTPNLYRPYTSRDFKDFMLRPVYHNQQVSNFENLAFKDPFNYDTNPNPLPKAGSILLTGASFDNSTVFSNSFFKNVTNIGAIGNEDWIKGWVNFLPLQTDYNN